MTGTVVWIKWRDACSEEAADPHTPVSASPLVELQEVGWLIGETEDAVSIAMEIDHDGAPSRWRLHIPKVNIIERRDMPLKRAFPVRRPRKVTARLETN